MLAAFGVVTGGAWHTVVDDEGLVAAGHQVAGLPVGAVSDL
jgi:hypothetical protein